MKDLSNLEEKELEFMKFFWSLDRPVTAQEFILECVTADEKNIHANLKSLLEKGFIDIIKENINTGEIIEFYSKKITIEEYVANQVLAIYEINNNFDIRILLTALYKNENLNLSLDDVKRFLNNNK